MSYCVIYFIVVNLSLSHCLRVLIFKILKQVFKNQLLLKKNNQIFFKCCINQLIMEKKRILVRDNKGFFLKMFKKKLNNEFSFFENSFLYTNKNESTEFDRSIFVIYDKFELVEFLRLDKKGANVLVCLFNKQLYDSLSFLEEVKSLILLDNFKTGDEITKELKSHFKDYSDLEPKKAKMRLPDPSSISSQFKHFYSIFFLDVTLT